MQSAMSTSPDAPAGITHIPDLQTPLAQSGPVLQVVFGSSTVGMQSSPSHTPLWQSLARVQDEPAGEPGTTPEPPDVEPPFALGRSPPEADAPEPPDALAPVSCPMSASLPPHPAKAAAIRLTNRTYEERLGNRAGSSKGASAHVMGGASSFSEPASARARPSACDRATSETVVRSSPPATARPYGARARPARKPRSARAPESSCLVGTGGHARR